VKKIKDKDFGYIGGADKGDEHGTIWLCGQVV